MLPASNYIFKSCQVVRIWWALIVEERLGRLVITQSLSQLNTPRSLLQCCVSWLSPSSDTNTGLSWQLVISRYQTITTATTSETPPGLHRYSSFPSKRCPGPSQGGGCPEKGCLLVFPNQSSSPFVDGPAPNLPVHGCYFPASEVWEHSWHLHEIQKKAYMRKSR